jgi:uncharacterized protein YjbI with pentapeptide repeats
VPAATLWGFLRYLPLHDRFGSTAAALWLAVAAGISVHYALHEEKGLLPDDSVPAGTIADNIFRLRSTASAVGAFAAAVGFAIVAWGPLSVAVGTIGIRTAVDLSDVRLDGAVGVASASSAGTVQVSNEPRELDLSGRDLRGARIRNATLANAVFAGADLEGADMSGSDFRGANFKNAVLSGAQLSNSNLLGANLAKADLTGANLVGATLIGADLSDAELGGAEFAHANLLSAILRPQQLEGASYDATTILPDEVRAALQPPAGTMTKIPGKGGKM